MWRESVFNLTLLQAQYSSNLQAYEAEFQHLWTQFKYGQCDQTILGLGDTFNMTS